MVVLNEEHLLSHSIPARLLTLSLGQIKVRVLISTDLREWITAEGLRDDFLHNQTRADDMDATNRLENQYEATVELVATFLGFVAQKLPEEPQATAARTSLLSNLLKHFTSSYLASKDVYTLTCAFDLKVRRVVLSAYFKVIATLQGQTVADIPTGSQSALLSAATSGNASIFALFGGQGTNEVYFDELQTLYDIYKSFVATFLATVTNNVLVPLADEQKASNHYAHGLDVIAWLNGTSTRPSVDYLSSVPISFPLMGLTQLIQYLIVYKITGLTPGELRDRIAGATGHSQGIVSAVVIAASASFEEFTENSQKALRWLFFSGLRSQQAFPLVSLEPSIVQDCIDGGEGTPSPMLSITGLTLEEVESHIKATNEYLPENSKVDLSLSNGPRASVVAGPARALYGLVTLLRNVRAPSGQDQTKIPFSQRKPVFTVRFLVTGVPYHSGYLRGVTEKILKEDIDEELWQAEDLKIPVYNTQNGQDLRLSTSSITRSLCEQIFTSPLHWSKATDFPEMATHAIDFGPGGLSGIGPLTARNLEGRGVRVIVVGDHGKGDTELYGAGEVKYEDRWSKKWSPSLVRTSDGTIYLDTPFSRLLGKPPIMVAGMTPSTVKAGFVSAILHAGYHVELAGGGHYDAAALHAKVVEIQKQIPTGVGITLNSLYINPRQFGFQLPLWQEMRKEGLPLEGFCIAGGIPSMEKAAEIINGLKDAGIKHVAFKPASVDGIRQVLNIAAANPRFPIILQWTGGRAGGHHSFEDFHQPILATYSTIRRHPNISLVAGSGFGCAEDIWPYLSGDWSVERFGVLPMPFDGFLLASRVMVAKEAHTSPSVKDLIVATSGVEDSAWEGTYVNPTGGVLTVLSELGEPIHKVATRGVKLWKEFDDTVFKLAKEKRAAWLNERRDEVIAKLNRDFAKPWFGWKRDGSIATDLGDMTYEEVVLRMVRLMYVSHEKRWVDRSLRDLTGDWLRRIEERFSGVYGTIGNPSVFQSYDSLDDPSPFVDTFFKAYPIATQQLVSSQDTSYFLAIAQRPGQKPVPFIPVLDASFEVWFKKDSLWAAEDIEAVFDQDPERVCILQGPVATKVSIAKDEPIKDILGNINTTLIQRLLERKYNNDESSIPTVDYLDEQPTPIAAEFPGVSRSESKDGVTYEIGNTLPETSGWLETLAGPTLGWLRALVASPTIVQGTSYIDNPLRRILVPRPGQKVVVTSSSITIYGAARSCGPDKSDFKALEIQYHASTKAVDVTMYEDRRDVSVPLSLQFQYRPSFGFAPIHEVMAGRNTRIKEFYWKLWYGDNEVLPALDPRETFIGPEVTIDAAAVEEFCAVVGNQGESYKAARNDTVLAPMDFAIVVGWKALLKSLFPPDVDGDLLKLVHISNSFRMVDSANTLRVGDVCRSTAKILSVINVNEGKVIKARGHVYRGDEQVIEIVSAFLYRGHFVDYENTFETTEDEYSLSLDTKAAVGLLQSKAWFKWIDQSKPLSAGTSLIFRFTSNASFKDRACYRNVNVFGDVFSRNQLKVLVKVGSVQLQQENSRGNPVLAYLQRHGSPQGLPVPLPDGGYTLTNDGSAVFITPLTNEPYSKVSGDFNPIHVNAYLSNYASLPSTITHGLWSSAATRRYIERIVARGHPDRVLAYDVSFVGMVLPNDELSVKLRHVGMRDGNFVLKVETFNDRGEKVIDGCAEVSQPTTVYVFTGQGSQQVGMGMDLYDNSLAARAVWDSADTHLLATYGFSIIEIVKDNPKVKTVHFGGAKGHVIRQRYMNMTYDTVDEDGKLRTLPLFDNIDIKTPKYTFRHPAGLLFGTQFAQIALVVTEKAAFEDMRAKGLVQKDCAFAGHSLGEFSALASITDVFPIPTLVDLGFYRGITMERAVKRNAENRSNYAMCAVNPSRISNTFSEAVLRKIVDSIAVITSSLLEIVNYNVEGQQYVCAGELIALQTMTNLLNVVKMQDTEVTKLTETILNDVVQSCYQKAVEQEQAEGYITLERGFATIPLPGIDVPFHSRHLQAGVMSFRAYLLKRINATLLKPDLLIGKYIPNLVAKPFELSREYIQIIYEQTASPKLDTLLRSWNQENWESVEQRQQLAFVILIELLAYQFASPVRWIETQDRLFTEFQFERLLEFGPSPVLAGMAVRTFKAKYKPRDDAVSHSRTFLCHAKNVTEIYYRYKDELVCPAGDDIQIERPASSTPAAAQVAVPVDVAVAPSRSFAVAEDVPVKAIDILTVIVAQKLKKRVDEIAVSKSIKDLTSGKSTLQNEILGDLQQEFASVPDKGEELPLVDLASCLSIGYTGGLGKYSNGLVSRLISGRMPGSFNAAAMKAYLAKHWGLGSSRANAVLLLATTFEPAKRLASDTEARTWLDVVVSNYAQHAGVSLVASSARASSDSAGGAAVNSEEFLKFQAEQKQFAVQHVELYMRYLGRDSRAGESAFDQEKATSAALRSKLDKITTEHGDTYIEGIQPLFDPLKARHFDSYWNWAREDALLVYHDIISGRLILTSPEATARCIALLSRADLETLAYLQCKADQCDPSKGQTYKLAKDFAQSLIDNMRDVLGKPPVYKDVTVPTAPCNNITEKGEIVYCEVNRVNIPTLEDYVEDMANIRRVHYDVLRLWPAVKIHPGTRRERKDRKEDVICSAPEGPDSTRLTIRSRRSLSQLLHTPLSSVIPASAVQVPLLNLKRRVGTNWEYSGNLTNAYFDVLREIATSGITFQDKNALLTGVGRGSIGIEIVKGLLLGGARVVITTSSYSRKTVDYYQSIFRTFGGRGSTLTVVPFNQASKKDVEALVDYVYETLGMDLDHIIPFAGIPENGREIDSLDDKSELAHRMMLVNLLRILGAVKMKKSRYHFITRPTQVILPLSPNHGLIGNDGLYSESKIGLETLLQRWSSENWSEYLCLAGAVIGWTRGTGLMGPTNIVAQELESYGVRTFSAKEMAFNILGLMHPRLSSITHVEPIWADFNGGMDTIPDLADITARVHETLHGTAALRRSVARDKAADFKVINGVEPEFLQTMGTLPRANFQYNFPDLESHESLRDLTHLRSLIDLEKVVVVTGFAEIGPWGSARTRWEMEAQGEFTMEGCIEMAWMMGFIKHFEGVREDGSIHVGWVDNKNGKLIDDKDIKGRYEKDILAHAGIRLVEPELFYGYDPNKKVSHQEVELIHDLEPLEIAESEAQKFKLQHGEKCDIWADESNRWFVKLKKGACVFIPKAFKFNRTVAAQIPTGWDARRYGIPDDIIAQIDRITLWALVCTAEALNMSGITDPYELYRHVHPSEVGTALGSGMGGVTSMSKLFKGRHAEQDIQNDILQETFINTTAGWINLLLMSSSGPVKIPVGACATALQSLEVASDTILSGKAKVMIAGGFDDISEEGSYEFANMKATSNAKTEFAMGREPAEMSRPATTSRAGFMEAQGAGVHILMNAKTALELGAPIRGILAFTSTSTDKAGRSVPAPGKGVLTVAREVPAKHPPRVLDVAYRSRQLSFRRAQISQWLSHEHVQLQEELYMCKTQGETVDDDYFASRVTEIEDEATQQEKDAVAMYGMLEGSDPRVAPLRRALAIWGLKLDDIDVLSIHGTGTSANEENETKIWNDIFTTLSRTPGNAVPVVAQKSLTGHAKGGSAAWQMSGLLQTLETGIIPGHRTSDNIDSRFRDRTFLMFPSKSIHTDGIRAGVMSSFGFGQVGGIALVLHPRYLFGALDPGYYERYKKRNLVWARQSYKAMSEMMVKNSLVRIKEHPPYVGDMEGKVLMNSLARATLNPKTGEYSFKDKLPTNTALDTSNVKIVKDFIEADGLPGRSLGACVGVGVDQELISAVPSQNLLFVARNFTDAEARYCQTQPSPASSFAARWAGKEAVFKSLGIKSKGAAASLLDIEILNDPETGAPTVTLHGDTKAQAAAKGVDKIAISLSHSEIVAIAFAQASSS